MKLFHIIIALVLLIIASGCTSTTEKNVEEKCIDLCRQAISSGKDLSDGPCLGNPMETDWVCDVAHEPRQLIDNVADNQCSAFRDGMVNHFVEVSPDCKFIKKI
jgi:hypothetical protein